LQRRTRHFAYAGFTWGTKDPIWRIFLNANGNNSSSAGAIKAAIAVWRYTLQVPQTVKLLLKDLLEKVQELDVKHKAVADGHTRNMLAVDALRHEIQVLCKSLKKQVHACHVVFHGV
jgi:hypothetical protein